MMFQPYSPPRLVAYVLIVMLVLLLTISLMLSYLIYFIYINWTSITQLHFLNPTSEMLIYNEYQEHITKFIGSNAVIAYL